MKEIVNVHVGQCGNQMGYDFWEGVCQEHSIQPDMTCADPEMIPYNNTYFEEIDQNRWTPRAVLVDLEPGVHDSILNRPYGQIFNPDLIYHEQSGAGNNFASGFYSTGSEIIEEVMEGIRKQAEKCEHLETFQITHSIGGGTGSGLGSLIMSQIKCEYPDKMLSCYSVVPSKTVSDVVVEPYNSVLAMNYLIEECDSNIIIDNEALYNIALHNLKQNDVSYSFINKIARRVMLETTSSLRFGGFNNAGVRKLCTNLCPFPRLHFLTTTLAPLRNMADRVYDLMGAKELTGELFDAKNAVCSSELSKGKLLTGAAIYRGKVETSVVETALADIHNKNSGSFVEWIPDSMLSSICHISNKDFATSAVMLGNTTSIQTIFQRLESQFEPMLKRKAFMHHYIQQGLDWNEMTEAQNNIRDLISEYQQYELSKADEAYEDDSSDEYEVVQKTSRSAANHSDNHSTHASSHHE